MSKNTRIAVVGLGKLGASMAAAFAERGFQTVGVDVIQSSVDAVNEGRAPVFETGLQDMIAANRNRLRATTSHAEAVQGADVSFVIVPTPSDPDGSFSLQYATYAMEKIGHALRGESNWHLVVMTSTVLPGACRHGLVPVLERASGKRVGKEIGFCYSPEFIALGTVIRDFLSPDFNLIGEWDRRSGDALESIYAGTVLNGAPSRRMSLENAELAKVALNSYVTMKISFANTLADICERVPGGDVDAVTSALGLDGRIGSKYLRGGMGFGGPCFPRDNKAFAFIANELGAPKELPESTDRFNQTWLSHIQGRIQKHISPGGSVAILGLAYKPGSVVLEASPSMQLAHSLVDAGYRVNAHDPLAREPARLEGKYRIVVHDRIEQALKDASLVVIATPDAAYRDLCPADFSECAKDCIVFDAWRLLRVKFENSPGLRYFAIGTCAPGDVSEEVLEKLWSNRAHMKGGS